MLSRAGLPCAVAAGLLVAVAVTSSRLGIANPLLALFLAALVWAEDAPAFKDQRQKASYAIGVTSSTVSESWCARPLGTVPRIVYSSSA